jgi:hypothetical protein
MEETQFSIYVWNKLPQHLKTSAFQMSDKEVAWEKDDALSVIEVFREFQIAIDGIEFFFFKGKNEPLQATSNIFSSEKRESETWQAFALRSSETAKAFVIQTHLEEREKYDGKPVFNIWATIEEE